jgi:hypothetical protein
LIRVGRAIAGGVFVHLRLTGVEQNKQPRIIRVVRIIDERIQQVRSRNRRPAGKVGSTSDIQRDRVRAILHCAIGEYQIDTGHSRIAKREITISVSAQAVQVERRIRHVVAAVVENDDQPG